MKSDFAVLVEFLESLGPEVVGRHLPEPETSVAAQLERFARGECSAAERADLCEMLRLHPAWLRWLADRVKLARPAVTRAADVREAF